MQTAEEEKEEEKQGGIRVSARAHFFFLSINNMNVTAFDNCPIS